MEKFEKGMDLSKTSAMSSSVLWDPDIFSFESSDLLASCWALHHKDKDEEVDVVGDDDESVSTES